LASVCQSPGLTATVTGVFELYGSDPVIPPSSSIYPQVVRLAGIITRKLETGGTQLDMEAVNGLALGDGTPLSRILEDLVPTADGAIVVKWTTEGEHIVKLLCKSRGSNRRQIMVDGGQVTVDARIDARKVDLRNRANFDLIIADIKDVESAVLAWLHEYRSTENKRVKRAAMLTLTRVLLLRGRELSTDIYDTINLRLRGQLEQVAESVFENLMKQPDGTHVSGGPIFAVKVSNEPWT